MLAIVFSRLVKFSSTGHFAVFLLGGVVVWSYFSLTIAAAGTAIVDNAELTSKIWFPRAALVLVPTLGNLVGYGASLGALLLLMPVLGAIPTPRVLLLVPATLLLVAFTLSLSLVVASLHVYMRDIRYGLQAIVLVWFYATPILYPQSALKDIGPLMDYNPMTGIVDVFRLATLGAGGDITRPLLVTVATCIVLMLVALELYRRRDRLYADML